MTKETHARHLIVKTIAICIGIDALVVMISMVFSIHWMAPVLSSALQISFASAFLFLFSAFGLFLMLRVIERSDEAAVILLPGVTMIIFIVAFTFVISRLVGTPTGLENLFVVPADPVVITDLLSMQSWPSLFSLFSFVLFGCVGLAVLFPGKLRDVTMLGAGSVIFLIGMFVMAGHLFGIPTLYLYGGVIQPMVFNSSLLFTILGTALLLLREPMTPL